MKKLFSVFSPPVKPEEPTKTVFTHITKGKITLNPYEPAPFVPPEESDHVVIDYIDWDSFNDCVYSITLVFSKKTEIPNTKYELQHKKYVKELREYEKDYKEWLEMKEKYDDEAKERRKQEYDKLKKEFEDES
jgi:hypothetical protein